MAISRTATGKSVKKSASVPSKAKKAAPKKSPAKPAMKLQARKATTPAKKLAIKNVVKGKSKR